jgi:hypothetical protein
MRSSPTSPASPHPAPTLARALAAAALVAAALAAGCTGDRDGPLAPVHPSARLVAAATGGDARASRLALAGAVDDALTRVVPALEGPGGRPPAALAAALTQLAATLQRPGAPTAAVTAQAGQALTALEASAAGNPGELADLAAVRLVLDRAAQLPE